MIFSLSLAIIWNVDEKDCCKRCFFALQSIFSFYDYEWICKHKKILLRGVLQEWYIPRVVLYREPLFLHQNRHMFFEIGGVRLWAVITETKGKVTIEESLESDLFLSLSFGNMNIHQFSCRDNFEFSEEEDWKIETIKK